MQDDVAIMADSTSRWAEALEENCPVVWKRCCRRRISGMLASDYQLFYERAGDDAQPNGTDRFL